MATFQTCPNFKRINTIKEFGLNCCKSILKAENILPFSLKCFQKSSSVWLLKGGLVFKNLT